jgi:hypothetical protein
VDGLRAVACLLASGASGFARLSPASVLSLRQFVAGIVDDIPLRMVRRKRDLKTAKAIGQYEDRDQQKAFEQPCDEDAANREHPNRRFSGQSLGGARKCWAESRLELIPSRRPFDEQLRRFGPLRDRFRNGGNFGHGFDYVLIS